MNPNKITLTALGTLSLCTAVAQTRPNVLVVMTDEHSFRTLGCYRELLSQEAAFPWGEGVAVETPNLDKLAAMGTLCTNYYATNPVSGPSRSSFMTGMYPQTTGVIKNDLKLNETMETFAQTLLDEGYATAYLGKWHLDGDAKPGWTPVDKFGFADNKYMCNRGHWKTLGHDQEGNPLVLDKTQSGMPLEEAMKTNKFVPMTFENATKENFITDFLTDRTIEFIECNKQNAFCVMLSIPDPHGPNKVRAPYDTMYDDVKYHKPASASVDAGKQIWRKKDKRSIIETADGMQNYFGMVKCIDDNMGKLLRCLERKKLMENTIIVFTADHGDMLGEHDRNDKGVPFEASAKVPYIMYYKGKIAAGKVQTEPMNNADFVPTLLGIMQVKSGVKYEGINRASSFVGNNVDYNKTGITVFRSQQWISATNGKRKVVFCLRNNDAPAMFDTENDPLEMTCIYNTKQYRGELAALAQYIKDYALRTNEPLWKSEKVRREVAEAIVQ